MALRRPGDQPRETIGLRPPARRLRRAPSCGTPLVIRGDADPNTAPLSGDKFDLGERAEAAIKVLRRIVEASEFLKV